MSRPLSIEQIKTIVRERGGDCLDDVYLNNHSPLTFSCAQNHIWTTSAKSIINGSWCRVCVQRNAKRTPEAIEQIKTFLSSKGGTLLSDYYVNNRELLTIQCAAGHKWKTIWKNLLKGSWCILCSRYKNNSVPTSYYDEKLNLIQQVAIERGGRCLTDHINRLSDKLEFECRFGHKWFATYQNVISKSSWCSICSSGRYERYCRAYFEQLWKQPFPKSRPDWLRSKRGYQLELDEYCESLGLAFEHNGNQHYQLNKYFGADLKQFKRQQENDTQKNKLCIEHGVTLITIPQINLYIQLCDLKSFIKNECIRLNFSIPIDFDDIQIDISDVMIDKNVKVLQ